MNNKRKKTQKQKQYSTLVSCLANGSTDKARQVLRDNNMPDAVNEEDLKLKLSELYIKTDDKIKLEKQFAQIHPHKDFILKYLGEPKIPQTKDEPLKPDPIEKDKEENAKKVLKEVVIHDGYASSAAGPESSQTTNSNNTAVIVGGIVGIVGIVAVIGLILKLKNN